MRRRAGETGKGRSKKKINTYRDLDVYQMAMNGAMEIFDLTKSFPAEEKYSLTDQIRRSSRSVCANISEAWRKRRYRMAFISKLSDAETEASETQVWVEFALRCGYLNTGLFDRIGNYYDNIIGKLVRMINNPTPWLLINKNTRETRRRNRE
jgi:four helix bundle protein